MTDVHEASFVPFNWPRMVGDELMHVGSAVAAGRLAGDGPFARRCAGWLEERIGCGAAFMTPSCSARLEMAARLAGVREGDEVIVLSFTLVSTASAVVRAGGTPVFADIEPETLNLDPESAAAALGPQTRHRDRPLRGRRVQYRGARRAYARRRRDGDRGRR